MKSAGTRVEKRTATDGINQLIRDNKDLKGEIRKEIKKTSHLTPEELSANLRETTKGLRQWTRETLKLPRLWMERPVPAKTGQMTGQNEPATKQLPEEIFSAKGNQISLKTNPKIKYVPENRLDIAQIGILYTSGNYVRYTAPTNHNGLKAGHTYWFRAHHIAPESKQKKVDFLEPVVYARRIFASKSPVGLLNRRSITNDKVSHDEAEALKEGGYVAVKARVNIPSKNGLIVKEGDVVWMEKKSAGSLTDVTDREIARKMKQKIEANELAWARHRRSTGTARVKK